MRYDFINLRYLGTQVKLKRISGWVWSFYRHPSGQWSVTAISPRRLPV